jgi:hypothetical protein
MSGVIEEYVFIALDDSEIRVIEMLRQPVSADENLRVDVPLAGNDWIDGRRAGSDACPHCRLLEVKSYCIIRPNAASCKWSGRRQLSLQHE